MSPRRAATDASAEYAGLLEQASISFPPSVVLSDGESVAGKFLRLEMAPTREYGMHPVVVFENAATGQEACLWLLHAALLSQFKRAKPQAGEKFVVVNLGKREAKTSKREYVDYRVVVEGREVRQAGETLSFDDLPEADTNGDKVPDFAK